MPLWSWIWWQMAVFLSRTDACDKLARGGSLCLDFQNNLLGGLTCQFYEVLLVWRSSSEKHVLNHIHVIDVFVFSSWDLKSHLRFIIEYFVAVKKSHFDGSFAMSFWHLSHMRPATRSTSNRICFGEIVVNRVVCCWWVWPKTGVGYLRLHCRLEFGSFSEGAKSSQEVPLISVIFLIGAQIFCPQKGFPS